MQCDTGKCDGKVVGPDSERWWRRKLLLWRPQELLFAAASVVVAELRAAVSNETGYSCSAGVASNKLLAKLCCGLHKPNQQTLLPNEAIAALLLPLELGRLRGLGAKLGVRGKGLLSRFCAHYQ
eukprot:SAG31_NODE_20385_length_576_cov_0.924528_1_plen_123_part_10